MDEMKIRTPFMKRLIAKIIKRVIDKKLGYQVDIQLNEISVTFDDEKATVHVNADAEMNKDELTKIIKKTGL